MRLLADTHVHLYPAYDAVRLLRGLGRQLAERARAGGCPDAPRVACFTERRECRAFAALAAGDAPSGVRVTRVLPHVLRVEGEALPAFALLAGRQLVAAEGLEVLALGRDLDLPDRALPLADLVAAVRAAGAAAVLPWAPGKWTGRRGRVVCDFLAACDPRAVALGDTTLRARGWPESYPMRLGRLRGCVVVAGSDPLPFPGEEAQAGTLASVLDVPAAAPDAAVSAAEALRAALYAGCAAARTVGDREGALAVVGRILRNYRSRRAGPRGADGAA